MNFSTPGGRPSQTHRARKLPDRGCPQPQHGRARWDVGYNSGLATAMVPLRLGTAAVRPSCDFAALRFSHLCGAHSVILLCLFVFLLPCLASDPPPRPRITGVSHIALYVHDIEKSRTFYKQFLGFDEPFFVTNKDGTLHLTWIKINDRQTIELFPEKEAGTDRLNHIALETDDALALRAYLGAHGVTVPEKVDKGRIRNLNFNVADP